MTTSNWNVSASGDWSDASDWSGGVPNSSTATATIAESGTYTVRIADGESFTVGSLTLDDPNATLNIAGTLDLTNTLTLTAGTFELSGTINGGVIDTGGGIFKSSNWNATLNGVAVDGTIDLNTSGTALTVSGGLAMEGANGTGAGTINLKGLGELYLTGTETIANAVLDVGSNGGALSEISNEGSGIATFASSTTLDAADPFFSLVSNSGSYVNDGSISAQSAYGIFYVQSVDFTNAGSVTVSNVNWLEFDNTNFANSGTISVSNRSFMSVEATSFSNTGTISVDGTSAISFQTALTTSQMGTVNVSSGATLDFTGTLNNTKATLVLPTNVSVGGTIDGGTIEGSFDIATAPPTEGQITPSLTLEGSPTLAGAGGTGAATITLTNPLFLSGTETIANVTINYSNGEGDISPVGSGTVTFSSSVTINQPGNSNYAGVSASLGSYYGASSSGSIVNDGTINIGSSASNPNDLPYFTIDPVSFTNAGTISVANDSLLIVDPSSFSNTGTISVAANSIVEFAAEVTTAELGTLSPASGALVDFQGTLNNTGSTFSPAPGADISGTIDGGTIEGTINISGGVNYGSVDTSLTLTGNPALKGAGGTGAATIDLGGYNALYFSGTETLSNATVDITNGGGTGIDVAGAGTLTIASNITLNQQTGSGGGTGTIYLGDDGVGTIINNGTINAGGNASYYTTMGFFVDPVAFTNAGTINVTDSDRLTLQAANFKNSGTISVDGTSTINFDFNVTVAQFGKLTVASGGTLDFGGTLNNVGTTFNVPTGVILEGTIDGGTIAGTIDAAGSTGLTLTGDPVLTGSGGSGPGTIDVGGLFSGLLTLSGTETIDNATINLGSDQGGAILNAGGVVTFGTGSTISQTNDGAATYYLGTDNNLLSYGSVINDGTIDAASANSKFWIDPPTFTNNGTIAVSNGDTLILNPGSFTNNGTISIDGTSTLQIDFTVTAAELGTINAASGATLKFGELNNAGATYVVPTGVNIEGTIDGGTIEGTINLTGSSAQLDLSGVTMLGAGGSGPGMINVTGDNSILYFQGSGTFSNATINVGSTLYYQPSSIDIGGTLASNVTINQTAAGTFADFGGGTNDGAINLASNGGTSIVSNGPFTNAGTIAVSNGDTLEIETFIPSDPFTNDGTISVDGTSSIEYVYGVTTTELGTIVATNGGVVNFAGTLDNTGAIFVVPTSATIEGTIQGGTIEGTLDVAYVPSLQFSVELTDSVTFEGQGGSGPGTIDLNGTLYLGGTETISDVTINAGKGPLFITGESDVTFASNVTFNNVSIEIQPFQAVPVLGTVVDNGSIIANTSGGTLTIEIPDFTNTGTITVTNGDTLYIEAVTGTPTTFVNIGTISVDSTSTLEFDSGMMTTAQIGTVNAAAGATIQFYGILNNTGATYVAPTGTFIEGTIEGGTLEGNFNVTGVNALQLSGTMTVANATIDIGASGAGGEAIVNVGGGVVTIASTTTIEQTFPDTAAFLGTDANNSQFPISDGTVVNDGTIVSSVSGSAFGVDPDVFTNNGLLEATNGGEIAAGSNSFTNLSNTTLTGGSYEAAAGGKFEFVAFTTFVTDDATLILSGSSAIMEQLNLNTNIVSTIESTLTSTGSGGTLEILGGRNWTQTTAFTNAGTIQLGGGTFQVSSLTGSGTIDGFGTVGVSASSASALVALGGTLNVSDGSLSGYSGGTLSTVTLGAGANATLQLPGGVSISTLNGTIELLGAGAAIESSSVTVQSTLKTIGASGVLVVGDSYSSSNAISNTGTIRMAGGTLSTGTLTDSAGSNLSGYGTVASVYNDSGSVTSSSGALVFTGTGDTFAGVLGGQEIDFGGGRDAVQSGTNLTVATLGVYGNASVTFAANESYAGILKLGVGTMSFGANALILSGTGSTIAGTISSTATLTFSGGSQAINSGAALSMSSWTLSGNDATTVNTSLSYGGTFLAGAGTTLSITAGDTLTLTANSSFAGTITGAGTLALSGGADTIAAGTQLTVGKLALSSGAKVTVSGSLTDSGTISQASGTSLLLGVNTLTLSGAGSVLDGAVTGTGTLALSGGSDTLGTGVALGVSNWSLASGATATLGTTFTYAGDLNEGAGTTLALGNDTLTLSASSTIAGSITGGGRLALSGGTQTFDSSAVLSIAKWSTSGTDVISIGGSVSFAEAFALGAGTSIAIGTDDSFSIAGSSTFAGKISGAGTLSFTGGTQALDGGTTLTAASWTISGSDTASIKEALGYGGSFTAGAGSTVAIVLEDSLTLSGTSTFSGTVNGAGSLILSGGAATLDAGANLAATKMTIHNGAAVTVAGSASIASNLTDATGDSIAVDTGAALTLSGTGSTFASAITGGGTLALVGGTDALNTGVSLGVADWSLASAAKATFNVALNYAGILTEAAGTELSLTDGLTLSGAGSTLAGQIAGNGALTLSSGSQTFNSGAALTMAKWLIFSHDVVTIDESLTYAKAFSQASGTTLTLGAGDTLSLSGTSIVDGTVNGTGTLQVANATVSGLVVGGTVTLNDTGTIVQSGQMTLGDASSNAAALTIAAAGTYEIDGNAGIGIGASASSVIEDSGLLIKNAGTGVSTIDGTIADSGHIEAARGTLDLVQAITGSGAMQVDAGATLEFGSSAASTLTMTFNGANGTLALASPSTFAATIAGFAAGDDIDLVKMKATAAVLEGNDQLLITNNAHTVATLQLTGTYTGYTFNTISDGHGGIDITATAPGSHAASSAGNDAATVIAELTQNPSHAGIAEWHLG